MENLFSNLQVTKNGVISSDLRQPIVKLSLPDNEDPMSYEVYYKIELSLSSDDASVLYCRQTDMVMSRENAHINTDIKYLQELYLKLLDTPKITFFEFVRRGMDMTGLSDGIM